MMSPISAIKAPWRWSISPTWRRRVLTVPGIVILSASRLLSLDVERGQDHGALDHLGELLRDPVCDEGVLQELQHRRADDGARDRHAPAGERRPCDGDGGNRVELHADAGVVR